MNNSVVLPSALFPPLSYFLLILNENKQGRKPVIEQNDYFVKQTIRNRYRICTSQGELLLSVPLNSKSSKSLLHDISINYNMAWQKEHFRTLNAAYSSTPFYEHYIDSLSPVFETQFNSLMDLNQWVFEKVTELLGLELKFDYSKYFEQFENSKDYRSTRNELFTELPSTYYQLNFDRKMPFVANLSILDLLFNLGPESRIWLNEAVQ